MDKQANKKTIRDVIRGSVPGGKLQHARIVLADKAGDTIGGFTEYDRKTGVTKIGTPAGMKATDITIRGHETRHATFHKAPKRKLQTPREILVGQIVDDVNVESKPLPGGVSAKGLADYRRAHLATAMRDIGRMKRVARDIKAGRRQSSVDQRNGDLICATRALSMLKNYGTGYGDTKSAETKARGFRAIADVIGRDSFRAINQVVEIAKSRRKRATAISVLLTLLEPEPEPEDWPDEETPKEPGGDVLAPVKPGDSIDGKMDILDLKPKSVFCAKEKSLRIRYAPTGVIINPTRYVNAIVSGCGDGLFIRHVKQDPGGTVVIDASGSMGANKKNLSALCKLIPTATVAYYSGREHAKGILTIYAFQGKRFNGKLPSDTLRGGNSVDLPAVKWLLAQRKPWIFVSDMQFCGGNIGSEIVAKALVERAKNRGELELHASLQAAYERFGGKGYLPGRFDDE